MGNYAIYLLLIVVAGVYLYYTEQLSPKSIFVSSLLLPVLTWIVGGIFLLILYPPWHTLVYTVDALPAAAVGILVMYGIQLLKAKYLPPAPPVSNPPAENPDAYEGFGGHG